MSNTGVTPGPWEINPHEAEYMVTAVLAPDHHMQRAAALVSTGKNKFRAISVGNERLGQVAIIPLDESNMANAKIVAAALDMAEALSSMLTYCRFIGLGSAEGYNDAITKARAALAKAGVK